MDGSAFPSYEPVASLPNPETAIPSPLSHETIVSDEVAQTRKDLPSHLANDPGLMPAALTVTVIISLVAVASSMKMKRRTGGHLGKQPICRSFQASTLNGDSSKETGVKGFE